MAWIFPRSLFFVVVIGLIGALREGVEDHLSVNAQYEDSLTASPNQSRACTDESEDCVSPEDTWSSLDITSSESELEEFPEVSPARVLADIATDVSTWDFPAQTTLTIKRTHPGGIDEITGIQLTLDPGITYDELIVEASGDEFGTQTHPAPAIKLVRQSTVRANCAGSTQDVSVAMVDRMNSSDLGIAQSPTRLFRLTASSKLEMQFARIRFQHGGLFKLCYTPDGTFTENDNGGIYNNVLNQTLQVYGLSSACNTDGCLAKERWDCWFSYKNEYASSCEVFVTGPQGDGRVGWDLQAGTQSKVTWSKVFPPPSGFDPATGTSVHDEDLGCNGTLADTTNILSQAGVGLKITVTSKVTLPSVMRTTKDGFAVAACYCSGLLGNCDQAQQYTQPFGVFYFWTLKICDLNDPTWCSPRYLRLFPQQRFSLRVDCPTGSNGCHRTNPETARIKIVVPPSTGEEKQSWDFTQHCKTAVEDPTIIVRDGLNQNGGSRRDYRLWGQGFSIRRSLDEILEVCICQSDCDNDVLNWFKVGEIQTTPHIGLSSVANRTVVNSERTIAIMNNPGTLGLYLGLNSSDDPLVTVMHPFESPKATRPALLNIMSFDRETPYGTPTNRRTLEQETGLDTQMVASDMQMVMDEICKNEVYSNELITGPASKQEAKNFIAYVTESAGVSHHLTFDGLLHDQKIVVKKSGVVSVCYCGEVNTANECQSRSWTYVGNLLIRGPVEQESWTLPLDVVVSLSVRGWGLSSRDKLRIIDPGMSCDSNNGNPPGLLTFKVNCPAVNGLGCDLATNATDIETFIQGSEKSGIFLQEITRDASRTLFTFSGPPGLVTGDLIMVDVLTIQVSSLTSSQWNPEQRYMAELAAGMRSFLDNSTVTYPVGLKVTVHPTEAAKVYIPVSIPGDDSSAPLTLQSLEGKWWRINQLYTNEEIRPITAYSSAKVCWATSTEYTHPQQRYYSQAGTITFVTPPTFQSPGVTVSLTSVRQGTVAPMVLSFKAGSPLYASADGSIVLVIRILDVVDGLVPYIVADQPPDGSTQPTPLPGSEAVAKEDASQSTCGRLFMEMWTSHGSGFPMPEGCYYSRVYLNSGLGEKYYRELYMRFPPRYGLRHACGSVDSPSFCDYQLVLLGSANLVTASTEAVELYTMCDGCEGANYQVYEKSTGNFGGSTISGASFADSKFDTDGEGVTLLSVDADRALYMTDVNFVPMLLKGGNGVNAIKPRNMLRIFLMPLTLWGSDTCQATCVPDINDQTTQCEGSQMTCQMEEVVPNSGRKNVVKLRLPEVMTDISQTIRHTVTVEGLAQPAGGVGWFPVRFGVQMSNADDLKPDYTTTYGMVWKDHTPVATSAKFLVTGYSQYGPKPFTDATDNMMVLRIQFGSPLFSLGQSQAADMVLLGPDGTGLTCNVLNQGKVPENIPIMHADNNGDGYPDDGKGHISSYSSDGSWALSSANQCTYSLRAGQYIPAGAVIFLHLTIGNGRAALKRNSDVNVWHIRFVSKGYGEASKIMSRFLFLEPQDETEHWIGNFAVLADLNFASIQPVSFLSNSETFLNVFFMTSSPPGRYSKIVIDSPEGFDFGVNCTVKDLPAFHYATITSDQTYPLVGVTNCDGVQFNLTSDVETTRYSRAIIEVSGIMERDRNYGFQVSVKTARVYTTDTHDGWQIWTRDRDNHGLDGARPPIRFNPLTPSTDPDFYDKSFGLYAAELAGYVTPTASINPSVSFESFLPYSISNVMSLITIDPFVVVVDMEVTIRVTAPQGYIWDPLTFSGSTPYSSSIITDVPVSVDNLQNELLWITPVLLRKERRYGLKCRAQIPDQTPTSSSNDFFVELGFMSEQLSLRRYASPLPAPRVAALVNCRVFYLSNMAAYTLNMITFEFEIITELGHNDGVIIRGGDVTQGFTFQQVCFPRAVDDSLPLPTVEGGYLCRTILEQQRPRITLSIIDPARLTPGIYKLELDSGNPPTAMTASYWTFSTHESVADYPNAPVLDMEMAAPGFEILDPMDAASIVPLSSVQKIQTDRDDRPNKMNNIIITFRLATTPASAETMTIRAPRGFRFEEDCLPGIVVDWREIFGSPDNFDALAYKKWDPSVSARPTECQGVGREAFVYIAFGIERDSTYAMRFRVQNPLITPDVNLWSLEFGGYASTPLEGFFLQTFEGSTLSSVSAAASVLGEPPINSPVSIAFTPTITIESRNFIGRRLEAEEEADKRSLQRVGTARGGTIVIDAPQGFNYSDPCMVRLQTQDGLTVFTMGVDMTCTILPTEPIALSVELVGTKSVKIDVPYELTYYVVNPINPQATPGDWVLKSFDPYGNALDEVTIGGFPVIRALEEFSVLNPTNTLKGTFKVKGATFYMSFPEQVMDDDIITVYAPSGFDLRGLTAGSCNEYIAPPELPLSLPTCQCAGATGCTLIFLIREGITPAVSVETVINFRVSTYNPARTPPLMESYWRVEHSRNDQVRSSSSYQVWEVVSQLTELSIELVGIKRAAESISDVRISFVPVAEANIVRVIAVAPAGFDFNEASVNLPLEKDARLSEQNMIVIGNVGMLPGTTTAFTINQVVLGLAGGQTIFTIETFIDEGLTQKVDESEYFEGGFRLPGRITTTEPELVSLFSRNRQSYPVKSLFGARIEESAWVVWQVHFSQPVYARETLVISCEPTDGNPAAKYQLLSQNFKLQGGTLIPTAPIVDQGTGDLNVLLIGVEGNVLVSSDREYILETAVLPKPGTQNWRIFTTDGLDYPTNTNDGDTPGFRPVLALTLVVEAPRRPPRAEISVRLTFDTQGIEVGYLIVIAPALFTFPEEGCGDMCFPGGLFTENRRTAEIRSLTGGNLEPAVLSSPITIRTITPSATPDTTEWYFQAMDRNDNALGWSEATGFNIDQMSPARVSYAGISSRVSQLEVLMWFVIWFRVSAPGGKRIEVIQDSYKFRCADSSYIVDIFLPGGKPECTDQEPLTLTVNSTLTAGTFAVAVKALMPEITPQDNTFDIIIRDSARGVRGGGMRRREPGQRTASCLKVLDAAIGTPGRQIVDAYAVNPSLSWELAEPSSETEVTVGITFQTSSDLFKAILISLPEGFIHRVTRPTEIINVNKNFPVAAGTSWADNSLSDAIRIIMDDTDERTVIEPGTYQWRFPVRLPRTLPPVNVWHISLCGTANCLTPWDDGTLVAHPIPGFLFYTTGRTDDEPSSAHIPLVSSAALLVAALLLTCVL